jgi:hypothetical protein
LYPAAFSRAARFRIATLAEAAFGDLAFLPVADSLGAVLAMSRGVYAQLSALATKLIKRRQVENDVVLK